MPGVALETVGFDNDHLHMLMVIPPKYSIASVMAQLKANRHLSFEKEIQVVTEGILEGKHSVITRLLRQQRRRG